jgi:hypothetical protein
LGSARGPRQKPEHPMDALAIEMGLDAKRDRVLLDKCTDKLCILRNMDEFLDLISGWYMRERGYLTQAHTCAKHSI